MQQTAKLFKTGRSQAVRLPSEFRFEGDEVANRKAPYTGDVILSPREKSLDRFFEMVAELTQEERNAFVLPPRDKSPARIPEFSK